ncbi:hypothetical protein T265_04964 [Opisthorchis viverrini]|uniref:Uncharacterized protein n=1 Tax=Opisthorchis viverrini TaxID=6198 RepID=A0A074ZM46_OPIVI|nr:hypothetical protein T265_04964 [Opisthorchis viverrini]KER28126.1 hypothetical protein T265_04964 [Opisthorchis viverrini]
MNRRLPESEMIYLKCWLTSVDIEPGRCVSPGGLAKDEISIRIGKARAAFANIRHLWRRRDISFSPLPANSAASVFLDGDPRRAISMTGDIVKYGPVAPSVALVHPSYCLQCIAPSPTPTPFDSPLTVLDLCTNLSAPACNAQLPTSPPKPSVIETAAVTTTVRRVRRFYG